MDDGIPYRTVCYPVKGDVKQSVLPSTMKSEVLKQCHDNLGHQGIERTFSVLKIDVIGQEYSRTSRPTAKIANVVVRLSQKINELDPL